jgi:hypothetical protein
LAIVAVALAFSAAPQAQRGGSAGAQQRPATSTAQRAATTPAAQKLPPLSYVCTMEADADVLEDKPGKCPKCGMDLVPVRLDAKWWCPVHQANEVSDGPGKCRRDGRELVQVTVSEYWTCGGDADKRQLEPGKCADGTPRKINYELRAHGDHNPKHGGQLFMASDAWHHIEGAYPQNGVFRLYFYNNFTKPMSVTGKGITARLAIRDDKDKEIATVPLVIAKDATTMEAKIPAANAAASAATPLRVTAKVKFTNTTPEQPFDFQFNAITKDPVPPGTSVGPTATPKTTAAPAAPKPAAPATTAATPKPAPAAPATTASNPPQRSGEPGSGPPDLYAGEIAPMPPALAAVLNEDVLPKTVPELVAELTNRSGQIDALMRDGNLSEVWLPAMGTKTVALVLETHAGSLPEAKREVVHSAVKRVVTSAWEIDGYGDLGNKTKIVEAYQRLSAAVADLKAAYEGIR